MTPASNKQPFAFDIAVEVIPHPDKVSFGGEDAHFVFDSLSFGVADGVGGWREGGINPADYSRLLMEITSEQLKQGNDIQSALELAHSKTRLPGSCTACLVKLDKTTGELSTLNLGDSGFVVLRENSVMARSTPQQHFFDCPKQLAAYPEFCQNTDYPKDGDAKTLSLTDGDIVIMGLLSNPVEMLCEIPMSAISTKGPSAHFDPIRERELVNGILSWDLEVHLEPPFMMGSPLSTDGLWDNVFDADVLNYTSEAYGRRKTVAELSEGLARLAQRNALNKEYPSPYSVAALAEGYDVSPFEKIMKARFSDGKFTWGTLTGGKIDDITVIVAKVRRQS